MAIHLTSKNYVDNVLEITAIKSKILLTENNIISLSEKHDGLEKLIELIQSEEKYLRIYYDEIDNDIINLRKIIGNLSDFRTANVYMIQEFKSRIMAHNTNKEVERIQQVVSTLVDEKAINNPERIINLSEKMRVHPKYVIENLLILGEMDNRLSLSSKMYTDGKIWNGIIPLSDLFEKEISPKNKAIHFDQEFINFLHENNESLSKMHWRNFERLIAQFFNSTGYEVELGPGSNDGGIDIRVYNKEKKEVGPPLIIIQCKRYKEENTVDINIVKAFYADLLHEGAERGLIATSSRIAPGGNKIITARNYNIDVAEATEVKDMVSTMWHNHFK